MNYNTSSEGPFPEPETVNVGEDLSAPPKNSKQAREAHALKEEMRSRRLELVGKLVPSKLSQFERAYSGKSLRAAINANCLDCMAYSQTEVKRCRVLDCPIHSVRPYQAKGGGSC